jgi:hypothetical protein
MEAQEFVQSFVDSGAILQGDVMGVNKVFVNGSAIAIVIMLDTTVTPPKAVEKYFFLKQRADTIDFYEMDRLPQV